MKEVEVKILEVDPAEVEKKLVTLGAKKIFEGTLTSVAFDFPDRYLSTQEILLRIRKEGDKSFLTLKKLKSVSGAKVSDEFQVEVSNFEQTLKIIQSLGLSPKRGYPLIKERTSYALGDVHFELDTFKEFPTYLEIEATDHKKIIELVKKLGYTEKDAKPWGVREVFNYYRDQGRLS